MNIISFTDELLRLRAAEQVIDKVASRYHPRQMGLVPRAMGWGAASGAGMYSGQKILSSAGAAEDPAWYGRTLLGDVAKGTVGAGIVAALMHMILKASKH